MKAYYPAPKFIEPSPATFITEAIGYYVTTQVELVSLDPKSAAISVKVTDTSTNEIVDMPLTLEYNAMLAKVPVYGTKSDCEAACKILNRAVKEKIAATIQAFSQI